MCAITLIPVHTKMSIEKTMVRNTITIIGDFILGACGFFSSIVSPFESEVATKKNTFHPVPPQFYLPRGNISKTVQNHSSRGLER
jgi:hypothetical protein